VPAPAVQPAPEPAAPPVSARSEEARFFELDILRGVAAYLVVIYHYKHFLFDAGNFDYDRLPLHTLLGPVYVYGQFFVELFFSISGYVFFWLYAEALSERRMGLRSFFIARFARLYPLYFVTFMVVALSQWAFHALYGDTYIYHHNTPGNFALNLFMVHEWIPHAEQTFNGPSWSISVEVFLYALFFAISYARLNTPLMLAAVAAAGLVFRYAQYDPAGDFSRGVPSFFFGGLAFYAVQFLRKDGREVWMQRVDTALKWGLPVLWLLTYVRAQPVLWQPIEQALHLKPPVAPLDTLTTEGFVYGLLPLTLLALGLRRDRWRTPLLSPERLHGFAWIGDISYSLYLIHFPLQITVMILIGHLPYAQRAAWFSSPLVMLLFLGLATGLARLSFVYFEMPMRNRVKRWLTDKLAVLNPQKAI
jgi:peptidoglycan/LPS O-acetylase OafA/YrhL